MNNNFNLISENNKEFINLMENLFYMFTHRKEYKDSLSEIQKRQILKDFYHNFFKNNDRDFQGLTISRPKSKMLEAEKNQIFEFEDRNGITWQFEIENLNYLEEKLVFKGVYYNLIDKMEIDGALLLKENISMLELHFFGVNKSIELVKPEVDQELIDLTLIAEDIDISELKDVGVKSIIYDMTNFNEIVNSYLNKEKKLKKTFKNE